LRVHALEDLRRILPGSLGDGIAGMEGERIGGRQKHGAEETDGRSRTREAVQRRRHRTRFEEQDGNGPGSEREHRRGNLGYRDKHQRQDARRNGKVEEKIGHAVDGVGYGLQELSGACGDGGHADPARDVSILGDAHQRVGDTQRAVERAAAERYFAAEAGRGLGQRIDEEHGGCKESDKQPCKGMRASGHGMSVRLVVPSLAQHRRDGTRTVQ